MNQTENDNQSVTVGPYAIHWLDRATPLTGDLTLHPDEERQASGIKSSKRRDEFERSRILMRRLAPWDRPFIADQLNRPSWPDGLRGSLTHKNGHIALAIIEAIRASAVGIDCEHADKNIDHLTDKICTPNDVAIIDQASSNLKTRASLIALLFSAKEALFKCHYPLGLKMFWFHDAELIDLNLNQNHLTLKVLIDTSPATPQGHTTLVHFAEQIASDGRYWLTVCTLPPSPTA